MAATVTVRAKAFGDSRIVFLSKLLGCSWNDAFVRMIRLWSVCAEQQTDKPEVRHIRACLEHTQGEVHLIESGLGDDKHRDPQLDDGVIRVRGCDETDWYFAAIEQQGRIEAGRARAALAERDAHGRYRSGAPPGQVQQTSSVGPASHSPDLRSDLLRPELPDPGKIVRAEHEKGIAPPSSGPAVTRHDLRRKLHVDSWTYAGLKHEELKREGVDPHARNCWSGLPGGSLETKELFARIDELTADQEDLRAAFARAGEVLRNRVDVAAAEARRDHTLRWFIPARMWDAKSFAIAKDLTPEQAAQPKTPAPRGPTARVAEQPIRKIPTFRG